MTKARAQPGFEPGTTRTLSEYHNPRPLSHTLYQQYHLPYKQNHVSKHNTIPSLHQSNTHPLHSRKPTTMPLNLFTHFKPLNNHNKHPSHQGHPIHAFLAHCTRGPINTSRIPLPHVINHSHHIHQPIHTEAPHTTQTHERACTPCLTQRPQHHWPTAIHTHTHTHSCVLCLWNPSPTSARTSA